VQSAKPDPSSLTALRGPYHISNVLSSLPMAPRLAPLLLSLLLTGLVGVAADAAAGAAHGVPVVAALEEDDACLGSPAGPSDQEALCSVSLRQLRGEIASRAKATLLSQEPQIAAGAAKAELAHPRAALEQQSGELAVAGGETVVDHRADNGAEASIQADSDAGTGAGGRTDTEAETEAVMERQVPPWMWKYWTPAPSWQWGNQPGWYQPSYHPSYTPPTRPAPSPSVQYGAAEMSFYMYRSKGANNFDDTSVNMANLPGVLWYLHNEVVRTCPRKFGITRVLRYKITYKPTSELGGNGFAHLCHFDSGACTGPSNSLHDYDRYGYVVGCDKPSTHTAAYKNAIWYSMPGPCPKQTFAAKSRDRWCSYREQGGECKGNEGWSRTCTWRKEFAGEVSLEELTGIHDYENWCKRGSYEWNQNCDCGHGTTFWNGKRDWGACSRRVEHLQKLFEQKYPNMPATLGEATCPYGDPHR